MDNQTAEQKQTTVQPTHTLEHAGIPTEQARTLATFIGVEVHHAVDKAVPLAVDAAVARAVPPAVEEAVAKAVPPAVDNAMAKAMEIFVTKDEFKLELAKVRAEMVTKDDLMHFQMTMIDRMNESNLATQAQINKTHLAIQAEINKKFDQLKTWVPTVVILLVGALNSLMVLWVKVL